MVDRILVDWFGRTYLMFSKTLEKRAHLAPSLSMPYICYRYYSQHPQNRQNDCAIVSFCPFDYRPTSRSYIENSVLVCLDGSIV